VCSNYLCNLRPGEQVMVTGPSGKRFLLPVGADDHDYLFLATGTGIAPFRGMLLELLDSRRGPCSSRIHLVMGSPYTTDLLYDDMFRRLESQHGNFRYHTAISREPRPPRASGIYCHHLIEEELDVFGPLLESPRTLVYICGLEGMQIGLYQVLARHGLDGAYMRIAPELQGTDPAAWTPERIKRFIRPSARCMVEVY
jgi:ferredoxin--NADP+ reductase